jgi:hypothetical protein
LDLLENSEIKRQPIGNHENEKNSSSGKKLEWGASYRVLKPEDSSRLDWVK